MNTDFRRTLRRGKSRTRHHHLTAASLDDPGWFKPALDIAVHPLSALRVGEQWRVRVR
ncbi:MAG TPA: hypothetical protein VMD27_03115 [Candidatus Aquilonibacter sp.]|nr:hypothetical protein [Candidatus Aquilonibacter sp.]